MTELTRRLRLDRPLDLVRTLQPLRRGAGDPTLALLNGEVWRASRTPAGPARLHLRRDGEELAATAWGPGARWLLDGLPDLIGQSDHWTALDLSGYPVLQGVRRRYAGVRLCRTNLVMESLVPAILEQRVTGGEARRAWRSLVVRHGERAPGPDGPAAWVMPDRAALLGVASWDWHRYGVDGQRYRTVAAAAELAIRLEECVVLAEAELTAALHRLRMVPGVGEWTAAEVSVRAFGDPDAVSVGDFHTKNRVGYALTGAARSTDEQMVELLEPWRGQRARIVRLVELSGLVPPKYGPRFSPGDFRAM